MTAFVIALVAMVLGLSAFGGAPAAAPPGLPDPGVGVGWAVPAARLAVDLAFIAVAGLLLLATFLLPGRSDRVEGIGVDALHVASRFAWLWAVAVAALYVVTAADVFARPVSDLSWSLLSQLTTQTSTGQAIVAQGIVAVAAAVVLRWSVSVRLLTSTLGVVLAAMAPLAAAGHSASSGSHDLAGLSLLLHIVAAALWIGGLGALGWVAFRHSRRFDAAFGRYSIMAAWAFVVMAITGVINGWLRVTTVADLLTTAYGGMLLVKTAGLVALGWFGWTQRRRLASTGASFGALAALEVVLMTAIVGFSVALSRTAPPQGDYLSTPAEEILGRTLPPEPTIGRVLFGFESSGIGLLIVGFGAALYLRGLWTLSQRDVTWPLGRTLAWFVGLAMIGWATCGGLGLYSHVTFSLHMVSHMVLTMVAPIFLVLGAPMTLALRTLPGPRQPGELSPRGLLTEFLHSRYSRFITFPIVPPIIFVGSLYALYFTPLFDLMMDSHWGHSFMVVHFVLSGALFYYIVIGVDPAPRRIPPVARFGVMVITLPFHAFFAVAVMSATTVIAKPYWQLIDAPYVPDLLHDQYIGGSTTWALGEVPLLIVMLALFAQWIRTDAREARRYDRKAARDDDAALAAYNARLRDLATHGKRRDPDSPV